MPTALVTRMFGLLRRRLAPQLLGVIAAAAPAAAQAPDDTTRLEPVVVTVTRMEQKADEAPASVTVTGASSPAISSPTPAS